MPTGFMFQGFLVMSKIYLDVCALCRPYDDQSFMRIRLETLAVHMILKAVESGYYRMFSSPVHFHEIFAISSENERIDLLMLLENLSVPCNADRSAARSRAEDFHSRGFGVADAAHLAFAEAVQADFISCDDRLLKKCIVSADLLIWTGNPVAFCEKEVLK